MKKNLLEAKFIGRDARAKLFQACDWSIATSCSLVLSLVDIEVWTRTYPLSDLEDLPIPLTPNWLSRSYQKTTGNIFSPRDIHSILTPTFSKQCQSSQQCVIQIMRKPAVTCLPPCSLTSLRTVLPLFLFLKFLF